MLITINNLQEVFAFMNRDGLSRHLRGIPKLLFLNHIVESHYKTIIRCMGQSEILSGKLRCENTWNQITLAIQLELQDQFIGICHHFDLLEHTGFKENNCNILFNNIIHDVLPDMDNKYYRVPLLVEFFDTLPEVFHKTKPKTGIATYINVHNGKISKLPNGDFCWRSRNWLSMITGVFFKEKHAPLYQAQPTITNHTPRSGFDDDNHIPKEVPRGVVLDFAPGLRF